jgi:hypothetical protein
VGGAISGNWVMGRLTIEINPSRVRMIDITVESTGRSINFLSI